MKNMLVFAVVLMVCITLVMHVRIYIFSASGGIDGSVASLHEGAQVFCVARSGSVAYDVKLNTLVVLSDGPAWAIFIEIF